MSEHPIIVKITSQKVLGYGTDWNGHYTEWQDSGIDKTGRSWQWKKKTYVRYDEKGRGDFIFGSSYDFEQIT